MGILGTIGCVSPDFPGSLAHAWGTARWAIPCPGKSNTRQAHKRYTQEGGIEMSETRYPVIIEQSGTGFSAYSPDVPGCAAVGDSIEETWRFWYLFTVRSEAERWQALFDSRNSRDRFSKQND
jgi:hypothetical protein